jgi:hypothetical protein
MKTYKHKKTGEIATYKDGILKSSGFSVEIGVEPSSEFWELVPQKEFEIMSFITNMAIGIIEKGNIVKRCSSIEFHGASGGLPIYAREDNLLKNGAWSIHSIKRLSDGEVFTIGDEVNHPGYAKGWTIASFKPDGCYFTIQDTNDGFCTGDRCLYIQKLKPVFTTQDGVDIYPGDHYFFVEKEDPTTIFPRKVPTNLREYEVYNNYHLRFSSRNAAEDYVQQNKRCLSVQDVHNVIKGTMHSSVILKQLKDLVKSR